MRLKVSLCLIRAFVFLVVLTIFKDDIHNLCRNEKLLFISNEEHNCYTNGDTGQITCYEKHWLDDSSTHTMLGPDVTVKMK